MLVFFLINIFQIGYLRINQPLPIENDHFWKIVTIFRRTVKHYRNIWLITKKAVILCQDDCYQNDRYLKCTPKWPLFNAPLNYRSFCLARIPKWPSDYQNDRYEIPKWPLLMFERLHWCWWWMFVTKWGWWHVRSPTSSNKIVATTRGGVEIRVKVKLGLGWIKGQGEIRVRVQ